MSDTTLNGGSVRILWDASSSAVVNITGNGNPSFTVNGSAVTFPYTLNSSTTFDTIHTGDYVVSVQHNGIEVAETPDGTKNVRLSGGGQVIFNPTADAGGRGKNLLDELSATFAPLNRGILNGSWAYLGDSITAGTAAANAGGFAGMVSWLSAQRVRLTQRSGKAGFRSDQLIPFIASEVIPSGAKTCFVLLGTNDAAQDVTLGTYKANMTSIVAQLRAAGIQPVLGTVPPRTDKRVLVGQYNAWLRTYAFQQGIPLVATHAALVDSSTGGLASGYDSGDGVHPTFAGHMAMAQAIVNEVGGLVPGGGVPLSNDNGDTTNLFTNGLFTTDATADGIADGWTTSSGTLTPTYSLVTDATRWKGKAQKLAMPAGSGYRRVTQTISTGFAPGDTLGWGFVFAVENLTGNVDGFKIDKVYTGGAGATVSTMSSVVGNVNKATYWETFVVPTGTTAIQCRYVCQTAGGSVDYLIAQSTLLNLTQLGLA